MRTLRSNLFGATIGLVAALGLAACGTDTNGPPPLQNPGEIVVENATQGSILEFRVRECGTSDWGPDLMDAVTTIPVDGQRTFTVEAGCYDLQAIHLDGPPPAELAPPVEEVDFVVLAGSARTWLVQAVGGGVTE